MAVHQLTCARCGTQFTYHRRKKYCSFHCRPSKPEPATRLADAACRQWHECAVCGTMFQPKKKGRTTTCGRKCGMLWAGFKSGVKQSGCRVSHSVRRVRCATCAAPMTQHRTEIYCSDECRNVEAYRKVVHAYRPFAGVCLECAKEFSAPYGDKRRVFCSKPCSLKAARRIARKKHRAVLKAARVENVSPTRVFMRDGWRCQSCGTKTPRAKRGTYDDRAPELDHIVPLSLGGDHSYQNTQCLCRRCNAAKSNGAGGQLLLFG